MKITSEERGLLKGKVYVLKEAGFSYSYIAKEIGHSKSFAKKLYIEAKAEYVAEDTVIDKYGFAILITVGLIVGIASYFWK